MLLKYTVHLTGNHKTLTALIIICHQVIISEQKAKNQHSEIDTSEMDMIGHDTKVEWGYMLERERQKPLWEVRLRSLIPLYDWNPHHTSDFKLLWN